MPIPFAEQLNGVQEPLKSIVLQILQEGNGRIGITGRGGFRTREMQQEMYKDYLNGGNLAAKPGHSMHERGLAVDFSGDLDLLAQIAPKYGLINSVDGEPWHWTLGEDIQVEGQEPHDFAYDVSADQDPQSVFENRITAVMRILGGTGSVGVQPMGGFDEQLAQLRFPDADTNPGSAIRRATATTAAAGNAAQLQDYARSQLAAFGWSESEMNALIELWNRESNWNPQADNPTSTAYGIAQQMESIHGPAARTGEGQIDWGLNYIKNRYGSPTRALSFHDRNNWY